MFHFRHNLVYILEYYIVSSNFFSFIPMELIPNSLIIKKKEVDSQHKYFKREVDDPQSSSLTTIDFILDPHHNSN